MNCKDIGAAKRIIAQFEERADGRHNSTALAVRQTETKPVQVEKTNALPVTFQPSHENLPFIDGLRRYMEHLRAIGLPQELAIRGTTIKTRWQDCEIGDYCQIPGTQFEPYNMQQTQRMLLPRRPDYGGWAFAVPVERRMDPAESYLFQQAILWDQINGERPFWKRIE